MNVPAQVHKALINVSLLKMLITWRGQILLVWAGGNLGV